MIVCPAIRWARSSGLCKRRLQSHQGKAPQRRRPRAVQDVDLLPVSMCRQLLEVFRPAVHRLRVTEARRVIAVPMLEGAGSLAVTPKQVDATSTLRYGQRDGRRSGIEERREPPADVLSPVPLSQNRESADLTAETLSDLRSVLNEPTAIKDEQVIRPRSKAERGIRHHNQSIDGTATPPADELHILRNQRRPGGDDKRFLQIVGSRRGQRIETTGKGRLPSGHFSLSVPLGSRYRIPINRIVAT